jgi:serine/threonine-protein kinase RsbW
LQAVTNEIRISPGVVSLVIPAKAEFIALGRLALTGLLRPLAVEPEVIADVKLALTEACSNSIRHAYADGREGAVEIRYELRDESIAVEVSDQGGGFEPLEPSPTEGDPDEGGLGIAIIRAVTDELSIGPRSGGTGSCLRFTKQLAP